MLKGAACPAEGVVVNSQPSGPDVERSRRRSFRLLAGGLLTVACVAGAGSLYARSADSAPVPAPAVPLAVRVSSPVAALAGTGTDGLVPWQQPVRVTVADGTLTDVRGTGPDGAAVAGTVGPDRAWTSSGTLFPSSDYRLVAQVTDAAGRVRDLPLSFRTGAPDRTLKVTVTPGDDAVVGVGQAVALRLGTPVQDPAARAELERRLQVTTVPAVTGAWRWMSSTELRYRAAEPWAPGTTISMSAALDRLQAAPGVWGSGSRTTTFTVGDAVTSVVDVAAHTMTVSRNGEVLKVMKASMGKPEFPTRNGTFVVLEKFEDKIMDSATVDLPPGTEAYRTAVKDAVRITNSGTFTHGAPWSARSQGVANVSHGCINLSPADADWFFQLARRGDVVTVVNSTEGPNPGDAGSQDWNMSFAEWSSGSALA